MKKQKINEEQIYVINQPKHITSSIVVLDNQFPISEGLHEDIEKLCDISDVLFVFAPSYFKAQENINFDKFASLYRSCAWIISGANLNGAILKLISYDIEVFNKHSNFLVINTKNLEERIDTEKLQAITASTLSKPIMEIRRLNSIEFYEIYLKGEDNHKEGLIANAVNYIKSYIEDGSIKDINRSHSTYYSTSSVMFFRKHTIETILSFYYNDPFSKTYINSFIEDDCGFMLGSVIKFLGIENFNRSYNTISL